MKKKTSLSFSLLMIFTTLLALPISAKEEYSGKTGSISIELTDTISNYPKDNVLFGIEKIADFIGGEFFMDEQYQHTEIDLNEIQTSEELEAAAKKLKKEVTDSDMLIKTDEQGYATASELPVGAYLVYAVDVVGYEMITPFIVSIPSFDEVDKVMKYDITVLPKHEDFPIFKIIKTDSKTGNVILNKDFEFTRYSDALCKEQVDSANGNTDDGYAVFKIRYGTWFIKESKSPYGYLLSDEIVKIELNDDGLFVNGDLMSKENNSYSITYENEQIPRTPNTGDDSNIQSFVMLIGISSIAIIGLMMANRKNKKEQ